MTRCRRSPLKAKPMAAFQSKNELAARVLASLLGVGAVGGTGAAYLKGDNAQARAVDAAAASARVEVKVETLEKNGDDTARHLGEHDKALQHIDRRTIRMEEQLKSVGDRLGVKRTIGPMEPDER